MKKLYIALAITFAAVTPALAGKNTQAPHIMVQFSLGQTIEQQYDALPQSVKQTLSLADFKSQGQSTLKGYDTYNTRLANATKGGGKHK